jgi:hypothetical protein
MEEKTKESIKIILNLFINDRIIEDEVIVLLATILDKEKTTYYPITIPYEPEPWKNPWDTRPWYNTDPYCKEYYTTTSNKVEEEKK